MKLSKISQKKAPNFSRQRRKETPFFFFAFSETDPHIFLACGQQRCAGRKRMCGKPHMCLLWYDTLRRFSGKWYNCATSQHFTKVSQHFNIHNPGTDVRTGLFEGQVGGFLDPPPLRARDAKYIFDTIRKQSTK